MCTENGTFCWRAFSKTCVYTTKIFFLFFYVHMFFKVTHVAQKFLNLCTHFFRVHEKNNFLCTGNICVHTFVNLCTEIVHHKFVYTKVFRVHEFMCAQYFCRKREHQKKVSQMLHMRNNNSPMCTILQKL